MGRLDTATCSAKDVVGHSADHPCFVEQVYYRVTPALFTRTCSRSYLSLTAEKSAEF